MSVRTAKDIITRSLQYLQIYAPGEILTDADAQAGLDILNSMLDSWSNESLACYANLEQSTTLVPGQQYYTIGPGGQINQTRPLTITVGPGAARITDSNNNQYDVEVVQQDKWNLIGAPYTTSDIPDTLFYNPQFPLGIIGIFPIPLIAYTLTWDSRLQLSDFATLETPMSFPPGYYKALWTNLAIDLFPFFSAKGDQLEGSMIAQAGLSKGNIKRTNIKEVVAGFDPEIVARAQQTYNIYSDSQSGTRGG